MSQASFSWLVFHLFLTLACYHMASGSDSGSGNVTQCKNETSRLQECLAQASPIVAQATDMGIPSSPEAVNLSCRAFNSGMRCFETFAKTCQKASLRQYFEDQASGARTLFKNLCNDQQYQKKYLEHIPCLKMISREWDACATRFMELVREEIGRANATEHARHVELCCSKFGFVRCVYATALRTCRKEDAAFVELLAETLSANRAHAPLCRHFETRRCTSSAPRRATLALTFLAALTGLSLAWGH